MIRTIKDTIHPGFLLERTGRYWLLANDLRLRAPHRHTLAFSLDADGGRSPFPFFRSDPPTGIAKMCDALIAVAHKDKVFLLAIEQKTSHAEGYKEQLANGRHFCNWLFSLYEEHGYLDVEVVSVALLIWQPRQSPAKGTTTHDQQPPAQKSRHGFDWFVERRNCQEIHLQVLLDSCVE